MRWEITDRLDRIPAANWNRLAGAYSPFVRHEFLVALERNGCVGEGTGWEPQHLLVYSDDDLVAAAPMYLKSHSYGEFVFDWSWADAYNRAGYDYYPKLVAAVPFTPATGPRLLIDDAAPPDSAAFLARAATEFAQARKVSSLHWLFTTPQHTACLEREQLMRRTGCQFHWSNPGYRDFEDFLAHLSSKKRKQIKRERREAAEAGLTVEVLNGHEISESQWDVFHRFYSSTFDRKWGFASLTPEFFKEIGRTMADAVVLLLAGRDGRYVAGAFGMRGQDTLFGRHWGCNRQYRSLHFELCYYRYIDYCIEHRLAGFEAGAQGEHKLSRGFLPVATLSAHWIRDPGFRAAIAEFLDREGRGISGYIDEMATHSPFKAPDSQPDTQVEPLCDQGSAPSRLKSVSSGRQGP